MCSKWGWKKLHNLKTHESDVFISVVNNIKSSKDYQFSIQKARTLIRTGKGSKPLSSCPFNQLNTNNKNLIIGFGSVVYG